MNLSTEIQNTWMRGLASLYEESELGLARAMLTVPGTCVESESDREPWLLMLTS